MSKLKETIGRVHLAHKVNYIVKTKEDSFEATLSGRFHYQAVSKSDYPVVGDYVQIRGEDTKIIERVVERKSALYRTYVNKKAEKQVLASNVDIIFICMSMNQDFNMKKLQNFVSLTYNSEAKVVILLTKKDLEKNNQSYIDKVQSEYDYEVLPIRVYDTSSIDQVKAIIGKQTAVLVGSSGVGKSSLINRIIGEKHLEVKDIRESDAQGRHTTSHRELIELDSGGSIIDTPGIRIVTNHLTDDIDGKFDQINDFV